MANKDKILNILKSHPTNVYCDDCLSSELGIHPRQQINQICNRLSQEGRIFRGDSRCSSCARYKKTNSAKPMMQKGESKKLATSETTSAEPREMNWRKFEIFARSELSKHLKVQLSESQLEGFPKRFDMVSPDGSIVGDAKFLTLVHGKRLPPAKFMEIAGHVWLLERVPSASRRFLVFGNQKRVPEWWLEKYGSLVRNVEFYFLDNSGELEKLNEISPI